MYVEEQGPREGTPVTFLHGAMVAGWMWLGQVDDLPEYHCLIPDYPGIGQSADDRWISCADTADKIANFVRTRCVGGSSHFVGLSLGGIIGLHIAVRHPDVVRSLIISGVPHGKIPLPLRLLSKAMLVLYSRPWGVGVIADIMGIPRDESRDAFVKTAMQTNTSVLKSITNEIYQSPLPLGLEGVSTATLVVAGMRDSAPAKLAVPHLCQLMPNAVGYMVPNVGHQWNAEQSALFSGMVRSWVDSQRVDDGFIRVCESI